MTTVGELMKALSQLPGDAPVLEVSYAGEHPLGADTLMVYRHDGNVALYIDDGEAYHPHLLPYWEPLGIGEEG